GGVACGADHEGGRVRRHRRHRRRHPRCTDRWVPVQLSGRVDGWRPARIHHRGRRRRGDSDFHPAPHQTRIETFRVSLSVGAALLCGVASPLFAASQDAAGESPRAAAAAWGDPPKVLRIAFPTDVSGLDPAGTQETYATGVEAKIFDSLYRWDYLERPYKFVPSVAAGMPEISTDGRVWTIRIRQGIYFADDPAFAGKKRELTAADFVYAWKRIVDPRVRSPNSDLLEGKIVGLDAAIAKAKASGRFDYDAEVQGLRAVDRHTLRLELIQPDYTFLELFDNSALRAVAREVIEKY